MINPKHLYDTLTLGSISFYTGVPDSLLKDFCAYVTDNTPDDRHVICANEGAAIAAVAGYFLGTGKPGLVYLQNSGFGNVINPLLSLADRDVYSIPMLLLIGWRGEPGRKDEPQHLKQGAVMLEMINSVQLPFMLLNETTELIEESISDLLGIMKSQQRPVALVVSAGTFEPYQLRRAITTNFEMNREAAIKVLIDQLGSDEVIVGTTGMTSREIYEYRKLRGQPHQRDFLTVGSMGHASQIAFGLSVARPDRAVWCVDGDGAAIMHLGSFAITGTRGPKNFRHILLNNGAHDSVGGQPTSGFDVDFCQIAKACGYRHAVLVDTAEMLKSQLEAAKGMSGPLFIEVRVNKGFRKDLGRPSTSPIQNRDDFMRFINR